MQIMECKLLEKHSWIVVTYIDVTEIVTNHWKNARDKVLIIFCETPVHGIATFTMAVCCIEWLWIETIAWLAINEAEPHFAVVHHVFFKKLFVIICLALRE
jgi:hypothetical protein